MSMEQMGGQSSMSANEQVDLKNQMQMALAISHDEDLVYFADNHAEEFGDLVENDPSILERYKKDPKGTLQSIEGKIYH